jgi:hypothetical protein
MAGGRRRSRKMRGGNGYGFGSPISAGALEVVPNMTSVADGAAYKPSGGRRRRSRKTRRRRGGYEVSAPPDPDMVTKDQCKDPGIWKPTKARTASGEVLGYCYSASGFQYPNRKGKHKGGRHTRRHRRSMRGGGSVAGVGYGFTGDGARGLANQTAYPSNLPPGGAFAIPTGTR